MKLSKGQGISLFAAIVIFGIFNTVVFLSPLYHGVNFWLGYFFALFALVAVASTLVLYFGKSVKEEKFLSLPSVKAAWTYFVIQTALSVWEMVAFPLTYIPALIINLVLGAVFAFVILALHAAAGKIDKSEEFTAEKVLFIKELKLKLDSIETDDAELAGKIKELAENVRFSDPMSHSKLEDIEDSLDEAVDELSANIADVPKALVLCGKVARLLKKRSEQCKMYKGVKDTVAADKQRSGKGGRIALAGVGVTLAMFLVALAVCFVVIPEHKYNSAMTLLEIEKYPEAIVAFEEIIDYRDSAVQTEVAKNAILQQRYDAAMILLDSEKYEEAIIAFEALGEFKDSNTKADAARTAILQGKYDAAAALAKEGKYDEAIAAFTEIKDFSDSASRIEDIKTTIKQNSYDVAEKYFNEGKYSEAINIYSTLDDFKDSKLRVEQIYNRLGDGDIIYFGTYNDAPIAWKILKTEEDKMLLIAENPITQKPFTDDIKRITWETSDLRVWLNGEFMSSFSAEQQNQILSTNTGEKEDKVFLLSVDEMVDLSKNVLFETTEEWWTRTSADDGIMYTTVKGWVKAEGDQVVRDKGVRPSIWINLK